MKTNTLLPPPNRIGAAWLENNSTASGDFAPVATLRISRNGKTHRPAAEWAGAGEERYRLLFDSNPQPMWVYDLETLRFLAVNAAAVAQYGYRREEFLELTIKELCLPEHVLRLLDSLDEVRHARPDQGPRRPALWRHRRKDDTGLDVELTARPAHWNGHRAELVLARDVTGTLCADRRSSVFTRLAGQLNVTTTAGQAGQMLVGAAEELFGWDACLCYLYDAARDQVRCVVSQDTLNGKKTDISLCASGGPPSPLLRYVLQHGNQLIQRDTEDVMPVVAQPFGDPTRLSASLMWVRVHLGPDIIGVLSIQSYSPLAYDEEALKGLQRLADLGAGALARIQAQESLQVTEARCQLLSRNQSEGLCVVDEADRLLSVNPAAERLFGAAPGDMVNRALGDFLSPEQREFVRHQTKRRLRGESVTYELSITHANGQTRVLLIAVTPQADAAGRYLQALCILRDITPQKRAELLVAQTQLRLQTVWDAALVPMRLTDATGTIVMVNRAYCDLVSLSRERLEGQPLSVVYSPASQEQALSDHARRFERDDHLQQRTAEVVFWNEKRAILEIAETFLSLPGQPPMLLSVIRDTTQQRETEAQLRQMQRLDSIGQLAAGVAHDFNNILAVIQGETGLLLMDAAVGSPTTEALRQIQQAAARAADLTRQLLLFSRQHTPQLAVVNLNEVVEGLAKMLKRLLSERIATRFVSSASPATVLADMGMMEQVLVNLCVNARDAMPKGGHLLVETSLVEPTDDDLARLPEARPGPHACLSVTDTGLGILPDALPHIFDPFFTTKEGGKGTGLGLATVHGIVKQHQGWIKVDTAVGQGTTFRVFLPQTDKPVAPSPPDQPKATPAEGHNKTILAVEDEPFLREVNCAVLQRHGYRVLSAESGPQALELAKTAGRIDLLLTDMLMPGDMTGRDLARALHEQQPDLPVLYTSGYNPGTGDTEFLTHPETHFLPKPHNAETLCQRVAECLQASVNRAGQDRVPAGIESNYETPRP